MASTENNDFKIKKALTNTEEKQELKSGKILTKRRLDYTEDDWGPEYLLASNGGYNPKQKTIYQEEETSFVDEVIHDDGDDGDQETY